MSFDLKDNKILKIILFIIAFGLVIGTGSLYRYMYNYNLIMLATLAMMFAVLCYQYFLPAFIKEGDKIKYLPNSINYSGLTLVFLMLFVVTLSDIVNEVQSLEILIFYAAILFISILLDEDYRNKIFGYYFIIIVVLSIISLIFIALSVFTNLLESIPHVKQNEHFITDFYYVWSNSPNVLFSRNQSIFWEPGAFGYHIILASLLAYKSKNKIFIIVLLVAGITTFSTSVYIFLFCIFLFHLLYNKKRLLFAVIIIISTTILFVIADIFMKNNMFLQLATSAILDKFLPSSTTYISFAGRSLYLVEAFKLFLDNIFLGAGHYGTAVKIDLVRSGVTVNSSSLVGLLAELGLYGIFCIILYIRFFNYFKILAIPITLIWLNGEFLQYSPISLFILADAADHFSKKIFP